jgi:hypothetical protein
MQISALPTFFPAIWANAASSPYINTIPTPSQEGVKAGAASFADGFPPLCFVPFASGGAGPFGSDFNGILAQVTAGIQWIQAGGPMVYSGTYSTAIGGYPNGAIIQSAATAGLFWRSTTDNNTSDPDTGGSNWVVALTPNSITSTLVASSGTLAVPASCGLCLLTVLGGGGGSNGSSGGAGGGGEVAYGYFAVTPGGTLTIVIGAAGTGATYPSNATAGGTSSVSGAGLSSALSAVGGGGAISGQPGAGGSSSGGPSGTIRLAGGDGMDLDATIPVATGGNAPLGLGYGGTINGSGNPFGPSGYGSGGGGNFNQANGQNGSPGVVLVTFFG